ncbi:MAG: 23S rRNA (adenine(2503)-C(2))-methyltransferase RlmN [Oscillospiraceae bacterium]|nr:23S rRNA (adenine(2503)-C(2))-methyltransferase RlmN [Oscillospiraceae bacterium]MDD4546096.1 23S rRNA (adenine(2503)-C(2))-methyltransferase RlmN [Oscillospiraceae bacterium]
MELIDCKSLTLEELGSHLAEMEVPAYRAAQIRSWLDRGVTNFDDMGNLPLKLRGELNKRFHIPSIRIKKKLVSERDYTVKYLYTLDDGENVESVLMKYHHGWSQCLSTQVGCKMGCTFCATGMDGCVRNLLASEMMAQIETAQSDHGVRVSSIVLMGMGEPLDNFDNLLRFLYMLGQPGGVQIGMRHVSLSTCGLVDKIYKLMEHKFQLTLSVSLHALNDNIRSQMMPINKRWPVSELLKACSIYAKTTGRRISFEYAMVDGVNDSDECARELAARLKGILCHVNLIPLNTVPEKQLRRSSDKRLGSFKAVLEKLGINVTVRRTLGSDINASCGQLRRMKEKE